MIRTLLSTLVLVALLAPATRAQTSPAAAQDEVTLRPGDLLRVEIWREPDLSGEFVVDDEGRITLPMLGEKNVNGVPLRGLRDQLIEEYRLQLRNPSINITPLRRVNVLGEVNKPGVYPVDPTVSLAGTIALAGGANQNGDLNRVRIVRGNTIMWERVGVGETLSTLDVRSGDQIVVERRNWFDRNSTFLVSMVLSVTGIIVSLVR